MIQPQVLQLARQGNPVAISALLTQQLRHQGIRVRARRSNQCLTLTLTANNPKLALDRRALIERIRAGLSQLNPKTIARVCIGLHRADRPDPLWQTEYAFTRSPVPPPDDRQLPLENDGIYAAVAKPPLHLPLSLQARAQQYDSEAIAQLLSLHLRRRVRRAKVISECLWVMVESNPVPDPQRLPLEVARHLSTLELPQLKTAIVSASCPGSDRLSWTQIVALDDRHSLAVALSVAELVEFYQRSVSPKLSPRS